MSTGLEKSISIGADRAKVFTALTKDEELMKWFPSVAKTDARQGGKMRYEWAFEASENDGFQDMEYLEFIENEKFSHTWDASGQATTVSFAVSGENGQTEVQVSHDGWEDGMEEAVQMHAEIWDGYLNNLKLYIEEGGDMRHMKGQKTS